ncbi:MAG: hypothetical protein LBB34_00575, partial [Holosporales bacterium]|jgi:hypothetical protein|nr:hypothetical protein [Holosporales bacterium]
MPVLVQEAKKKRPYKKPVKKKVVKKSKPPIVVSSAALHFADEFVTFVLSLPSDKNKRRRPQRNVWGEQLQKFIDTSDYGFIQIHAVFIWYTLHHQEIWRIESPNSFIKHFPSLLKRYKRSINPYSSQQLQPLMDSLMRLQWDCCDDELECVVGRSLGMVKQLRRVINKLLKKKYCFILNSQISDEFDFVRSHFENWFWKQINTENIRFAEITKKKILKMVFRWLKLYGVDNSVVNEIIHTLDCLNEVSFDLEIS